MAFTVRSLRKLIFYLGYYVRLLVLREEVPLILGLVLTDQCNLTCKHCRVSNLPRDPLTMKQVASMLGDYYRRGFRELYIEGGEPLLWRDRGHTVEDVVACARKLGYFHVHIYTNGLFPLESAADIVWVSVDGMADSYRTLRGDCFDKVIQNIKDSSHRRIAIVYTINRVNRGEILEFLRFVSGEAIAGLGVMFHFHTPYYGIDELFLDKRERSTIIDEILRCKKMGLPVLNSTSGLRALRAGSWKRQNKTWWIADVDGEYACCRHNSGEVCPDCGYSTCTEISEAQRLSPSAVRYLMRFW